MPSFQELASPWGDRQKADGGIGLRWDCAEGCLLETGGVLSESWLRPQRPFSLGRELTLLMIHVGFRDPLSGLMVP